MDWTTSWMGDRRLGERYPAASIPVLWYVDRRRRLLGRNDPITGHVIDISAVGAGILAPDAPELVRTCMVNIDWDGARALVEIRHVDPGPVPRTSLYGVQFEVVSEDFTHQLDRYLAEMRPTSVDASRPY